MPVAPVPDLAPLAVALCERGYTPAALEYVLAYARDIGTLEGCPYVDPEDRAALDEVLEGSWPAEASTSHRWDDDRTGGRPSRWTIAAGALVPPELDPEPFEPTEEDLADYAAWSAAMEERYPLPELEPFHP